MNKTSWFFIAHSIRHMNQVKENEETWWCVDRRCIKGDKAFLYKPQEGVICYFEILEMNNSQLFCKSYGMETGLIKILKLFKEPISAKKLKTYPILKKEPFIAKNFQGKSFVIREEASVRKMLSL